MKTQLLKSLHEKAIITLGLIEKAEIKKANIIQLLVKHSMTNYGNELKLWPLGRPYGKQWQSEENLTHDLGIINMSLVRMEAYYFNLISKINNNVYEQSTATNA